MSLLNEASFLVTPNGYKEDKLYAAIPTNGNGDMTVTRATTATRVNEAGLVELVPYNLLLRSQEFDNAAWTKSASSITANTIVSPDGTVDADKLVEDTANTAHNINRSQGVTTGASYAFTVYAKAAERSFFRLQSFNAIGDAENAVFDLSTGTIFSQSGTSASTITPVGNGWYRCSVIVINDTDTSSTFSIQLYSDGTTSSYTGDGYSGIYIWGAQLNEGSSALTYQKTVDRLDIPRIDYTGGGCPSILLEPQRTNLVLRSEEFDNASFQKNRSSISAKNTTAPDGTLTADTWTGDGTFSTHFLAQIVSATSGVAYTQSVFAKKGTNDFIQIVGTTAIYDANSWANFDLENGVVSLSGASATATITDFGNGWYRCTMTATATTTASGIGFLLWLITSAGSARVEGNSLATSVRLWGAQLEVGAYPTSYIPTTTATVTRNADVISKTGISDLIGQTEGVLFIETAALNNDLTGNRSISISDGSSNNRTGINYNFTSNNIQTVVTVAGVTQTSINYVLADETDFAKIALRYRVNDITLWVNGEKRGTDVTSYTLPSVDFTKLAFNSGAGVSPFYGKAKQVQLYKTYLSNDEMAALTTL
jgi:hypothetical protein